MKAVILNVSGRLQAWGDHLTNARVRTISHHIPMRAGIGLLGACCGITRNDKGWYHEFDFASFSPTGRCKQTDYQTISRTICSKDNHSLENKDAVIEHREFEYSADDDIIAIVPKDNCRFSIDQLIEFIKQPVFTPYLGRKCHPLTAPLAAGMEIINGDGSDIINAIKGRASADGVIRSPWGVDGELNSVEYDGPTHNERIVYIEKVEF